MKLNQILFILLCLILLNGCGGAYQKRIYFRPVQYPSWEHVEKKIRSETIDYYQFDCSGKKILVYPILYDYQTEHWVEFGVPIPHKREQGKREEYLRDIFYNYGKKFESDDIVAVSVNFINFPQGNFYPVEIITPDNRIFHPIDEKQFDRKDVGYGVNNIYFFDADLMKQDNITIRFADKSGTCNPPAVVLRKEITTGTYYSGQIM